MKTKILSANELEEYIDKHEGSKCAVIYFGNINAVKLHNAVPIIVSDVSVMDFDEIEDYDSYFSEAGRIAEFIAGADSSAEIICVDECGQDISSACAAAVEEYYNNNAINVFSDYRFSPNQVIYNKLLNALYRVGEKERDNRFHYIFAQEYDDVVFRLIDFYGKDSKELYDFFDFAEKVTSDRYGKGGVHFAEIIEDRKNYTLGNDVPTKCTDDIFEYRELLRVYLEQCGLSEEEAFELSEKVRMGFFYKKTFSHPLIPVYVTKWFSKVKYLPSVKRLLKNTQQL